MLQLMQYLIYREYSSAVLQSSRCVAQKCVQFHCTDESMHFAEHQEQNDRFYRQKQAQESVIDRRIISRLFVSYFSKGKGKSARQDILQVIARVLDFDTEDRITCRIDPPSSAQGPNSTSAAMSSRGGSRRTSDSTISSTKSTSRSQSRSSRRGSPAPTRRYTNPFDADLY